MNFEQVKAYDVRELCARDEIVLAQLIDEITAKGIKDNVDFIFLKRCEEPYNDLFVRKGFSPFLESVIMIALFDPKELLSSLSEPIENGQILELVIKGFAPISIKVGEKRITVIEAEKSDLIVSTDSKTFLRLFFGRTSFRREFIRRRIRVSSISGLGIANKLFKVIRHDEWYIPMGDWV